MKNKIIQSLVFLFITIVIPILLFVFYMNIVNDYCTKKEEKTAQHIKQFIPDGFDDVAKDNIIVVVDDKTYQIYSKKNLK